MKNSITKFHNVLNDTIDYFLLGDIESLKTYQIKNNLDNDLATEFTTNESGDEIVKEGVLIPMSGIVNQPYTIIFNTSGVDSEFSVKENKVHLEKTGYVLKIENSKLFLFTWRILNDFSEERISEIVNNHQKRNIPSIEIKNGWYDVKILGGFTKQKSEFKDVNNNTITDYEFEPTFEFILKERAEKGVFEAKSNQSFELINDSC